MSNVSFNLADLFEEMEQETTFQSIILYPKKGDTHILAMMQPAEYEGKYKLSLPVKGEYQGKETKQHVVRFLLIPRVGKEFKWDLATPVAIPLASSYVNQIVTLFKTDYTFAEQKCNLLVLTKDAKTTLTPTPKFVEIPDEVWNQELSWETVLTEYETMQANFAKKSESDSSESKEEKLLKDLMG